mmetsp:Transcript_29105/g.78040  ORF Transcript_29105/g.78040 Transcript_29105/m.78040 type:complete len:211 (+) Transcript_29105:917-1549(+)
MASPVPLNILVSDVHRMSAWPPPRKSVLQKLASVSSTTTAKPNSSARLLSCAMSGHLSNGLEGNSVNTPIILSFVHASLSSSNSQPCPRKMQPSHHSGRRHILRVSRYGNPKTTALYPGGKIRRRAVSAVKIVDMPDAARYTLSTDSFVRPAIRWRRSVRTRPASGLFSWATWQPGAVHARSPVTNSFVGCMSASIPPSFASIELMAASQ